MFRERGGSSTFARHAFNELIAFIAGWAILIDYLIVIALAALSVPHYLEPVSGELRPAGLGDRPIARRGDRRRLRAQHLQRHRPRAAGVADPAGARRPRAAAGGDRRRRRGRHAPRPADRPARPLHRPQLPRHRLRGGGGDARLRRDRGRLRPRPRHRRQPQGPEAGGQRRGDRRCRSSTPGWRRSR